MKGCENCLQEEHGVIIKTIRDRDMLLCAHCGRMLYQYGHENVSCAVRPEFKMNEQMVDAFIDYLGKRPYAEVESMMQVMRELKQNFYNK